VRRQRQAAQCHARAAQGQEFAPTYPSKPSYPMFHERDSSLAVFPEVYSMYAIARRAIGPARTFQSIIDHIASSGILADG